MMASLLLLCLALAERPGNGGAPANEILFLPVPVSSLCHHLVYGSNGWLLDCALLGPGSIPRSQIKLVVVGWITTPGLEITEQAFVKEPLTITDLWQWSHPPPHSSVCLKAYSQTMLQAVKKLLHPVWYITLRSPFVFCIYVCCCLTILKFFAIQSTFLESQAASQDLM